MNKKFYGEFDSSDLNGGTYDYASPDNRFNIPGHMKMDVDPWIVWGNNATDKGDWKSILKRRGGLSYPVRGEFGFIRYINLEDSLYNEAVRGYMEQPFVIGNGN